MATSESGHEKSATGTVWLVSGLAAFTNIRLGSLQPEDFVLIVLLAVCLGRFLARGGYFRIEPSLAWLSKAYLLLIVALGVMAALALRLKFFPLDNASLLKQPFLFSLSKLVQLAACVCGFLWLANGAAQRTLWLQLTLKAYWLIGIASAVYSICCWVLVYRLHLTVSPTSLLGAYHPDLTGSSIRVRGFFNEGGPYGIYLVSVALIGMLQRKLYGVRLGRITGTVLLVVFVMAQSKSAFLLALLLLLAFLASVSSFRSRMVYLFVSACLITGVAIQINLLAQLEAYYTAYENLEQRMSVLGNDANLVLGRVASAYIIPRMIEAHPITGIGIGNYPLMRNDPQYLGKLPAILYQEDLPALGILGEACEIGVPATLFLLVLFCVPFVRCRRYGAAIMLAAIFQPLAHLLGAQITYFYPWLVSACALGACVQSKKIAIVDSSPSAISEVR